MEWPRWGVSKRGNRAVFIAAGIVVFSFFTSCSKASFPKEQLLEDVRKLCREEYNLDVSVKVVGRTLGTFIVLDNIFDREQGLSKEASEHLGDILLGVSRVSLSTDAPLDFYVVIAADKTIPGVEAVFVRYVYDVKRYLLGSISRDDFFHRLMIDVRFNPAMMAERTVLNFFSNLSMGNTKQLLANYLRGTSESTEFSLAFLRMILEMKLKENAHFEILQMKIKPLAGEKALVYCKVKETYKAKSGYTDQDFTFPSGFVHEYLFLIGSSNYLPEIREIIPLDFKDETGTFKKRPFPEEFSRFGDIEKWPKKDFLLEDIKLPDFVAGQMAQRIIREVRQVEEKFDRQKKKLQAKGLKDETTGSLDYKLESVKGHYVAKDGQKTNEPAIMLDFRFSSAPGSEPIPNKLYELSLGIIKDVAEKYKFQDFSEIHLSNATTKGVKVIPRKDIF